MFIMYYVQVDLIFGGQVSVLQLLLKENCVKIQLCLKNLVWIKPVLVLKKFGSIDADTLWPDAWKLKISVKDLTPNNFNTYIEYFINGWNSSTVKYLEKKETERTNAMA